MKRAEFLEIDRKNKADQSELLRLRLQVKQFAAEQQQLVSNSLNHTQVSASHPSYF